MEVGWIESGGDRSHRETRNQHLGPGGLRFGRRPHPPDDQETCCGEEPQHRTKEPSRRHVNPPLGGRGGDSWNYAATTERDFALRQSFGAPFNQKADNDRKM